MSKPTLTGPEYVHGLYIPAGLILAGCAIIKLEWMPYALALTLALGTWKFYELRELFPAPRLEWPLFLTLFSAHRA